MSLGWIGRDWVERREGNWQGRDAKGQGSEMGGGNGWEDSVGKYQIKRIQIKVKITRSLSDFKSKSLIMKLIGSYFTIKIADPQEPHCCIILHILSQWAWKSANGLDLYACLRKKSLNVIFHPFTKKFYWKLVTKFGIMGSSWAGLPNQMCQYLAVDSRVSIQYGGEQTSIHCHWLEVSPVRQFCAMALPAIWAAGCHQYNGLWCPPLVNMGMKIS